MDAACTTTESTQDTAQRDEHTVPEIAVLLVENDAHDCAVTREQLASATAQRFAITWVTQLGAALDHIATGAVDVVILALSLPDSDGWRTFTRLHDAARHLPIIVLADAGDEEMALEMIKHGVQDYIIKGRADAEQFVRSIRYAIERKRMEAILHERHDQLDSKVADATRDLLTANERLRRENAEREAAETKLKEAVARLEAHSHAKSQFVSNVSHELRTPLASMAHALENLRAGVLGPFDERVREYVLMMEEDCRRLTGTVGDILDMNRIEANRLELNCRKVHFGRFVAQIIDALRLQTERKRQRVAIEQQDRTVFVECDARRMERVVINLVGNAIKFTPEGGQISVLVGREGEGGDRVMLSVIDDGVGIPREHLPRVTERYYRVGEHVDGSGLGLALCKDLVEMHGGEMQMLSPPAGRDRGTQAMLWLPAAPAPRVLAVDDDAMVRSLLERQLAAAGYCPSSAGTGEEALGILQCDPRPDMLIVDVFMPGMSGFELIGRVKSEARLRETPVLVITGRELGAEHRAFLEGFGLRHLMKPWHRGKLLECLEQITIGPR
jgi:signal transduction histidine kinase